MSKQREALLMALDTLRGWIGIDEWIWPVSAKETCKKNSIEVIAAIREALAERELLLDERASSQACHVAWKQCANTIDKFDGDPHGAFTMGFHAGIQASVNAKHPPAKPAAYLDLSNNISYSMRELSNEDAYDTDAMVPLYLSPPARKSEPEQEPVAWRIADERDWEYRTEPPLEADIQWSARYGRKYEPLYASPPSRKPDPAIIPMSSLASVVAQKRGNCSVRNTAKYIGISPTTLLKIQQGHIPDKKTLDAVCNWAGVSLGVSPATRKPLTDEKIMEICRELGKQCRLGGNPNIEFDYARAIERAHGIGDD